MATTRTTIEQALKEFYLPAVREQLNQSNPFLAQIESTNKNVEGLEAVVALHVSRNQGVGARAEGGTLPTAGNQGYKQSKVPLYNNYGRIEVSGRVLKDTRSDSGSYVRALDSEMKGIVNDIKRDYSRQIFGTSNGVIATCGTTADATLVVLATTTSKTQMRQFEVGMVIDIGTVAAPTTIAEARTIEAVDRVNKTLEISGASVTTSSSHFIFRTGNGGAIGGVGQKEITGLQTIVDSSGTLHDVSPTSYPVWASYEDDNSGTLRAPTDALFEEALDEIAIESGEEPNLIVTSYGVGRAYADGLKDQKRFSNTIDLKGGFKALSVSSGTQELALLRDRDCPAKTAFLLNTNHLTHNVESDWEWMDDDGAILNRVPDKDAYEATLFRYSELTTDQRNAHGKVVDLTDPGA
jgi:hypothetical protein